MKDINAGEMSMQETVALLKLLLDGNIQFICACENIVFRDGNTPPQGKAQRARMRQALMEGLGIDAFTANRGMEEAVVLREKRQQAFQIISGALDDGEPEEEIIERTAEECDLSEPYVRVTMFFVRRAKNECGI